MSLLALSAKYNTENLKEKKRKQKRPAIPVRDEKDTGCDTKEIYERHDGSKGEKQKIIDIVTSK
jgi:hypothetical protein